MRKTKFQRLLAALLCLMFVMGCFSLPTFAAEASSSSETSSSTTANKSNIDEIRELLNAITYEEYTKINSGVTEKADAPIVVDAIADIVADKTTAKYVVATFGEGDEKYEGVFSPASGTITWKVNVPKTAKYVISIEYYPIDEFTYGEGDNAVTIKGKAAPIERIFKINDSVPFKEARYLSLNKNWVNDYNDYVYDGEDVANVKKEATDAGMKFEEKDGKLVFPFPGVWDSKKADFCEKYGIRFMIEDINGNELRPDAVQAPYWMEYELRDSTGYYSSAFEFALEAGENFISLEGKNETMAIKSITLKAMEDIDTYEEYMKNLTANGHNGNGSGKIKIEG